MAPITYSNSKGVKIWSRQTMYEIREELRKPMSKDVIVPENFRELEEAIDEISESENITNERQFFDLYRIKILKLD